MVNPAILWDTLKAIIRGRTIKFLARLNSKKKNDKLKLLEKEVYDLTRVRDGTLLTSPKFSELCEHLEIKKRNWMNCIFN